MRKILFTCDYCKKTITGTDIPQKPHIRILRAEIRFSRKGFRPVVNKIDDEDNELHFCNSRCLSAYFKAQIDEVKK